jgi:hypothetical protein
LKKNPKKKFKKAKKKFKKAKKKNKKSKTFFAFLRLRKSL